MKLSENWLREWVNPDISREKLIHQLTMTGIGVESCEPFEDDFIFEFELTPNRADCLSVQGIAREISVITDSDFLDAAVLCPDINPDININKNIDIKNKNNIDIFLDAPKACPRYLGQVIENFTPAQVTPEFIQKKLQKSGMKLIHPIVDILNYVMLELGQPLHAFDRDKLKNTVIIRHAKPGEKITVLDGKELILSENTLVIADELQPHALAGIMGGRDSAVSDQTQTILIESAFFTPAAIAGQARHYGLHTDAAHRFERGVDPNLPTKALARAIDLLKNIYPDLRIFPVMEKSDSHYLPKMSEINLRYARVEKILGINLSAQAIQAILKKLNFKIHPDASFSSHFLLAAPPSYRFDITQEIDLIEEIARIYGYENIPAVNLPNNHSNPANTAHISSPNILKKIINLLAYSGYQEIITYSFISEKEHQLFEADQKNIPLCLTHPLSAELAVMRSSLWPGLINTVQYNLNRQQTYLRFFETGLRFVKNQQESMLAGALAGSLFPEQWGETTRSVDFFDMKNTLEQIFTLTGESDLFSFETGVHAALHPAQTARILKQGELIGFCGMLHPEIQQILDIKIPVFLFELKLQALLTPNLQSVFNQYKYYQKFSKFPSIRRDIALLVNKNMTAGELKNMITANIETKKYLKDMCIFDVYQDKKLDQTHQKSIGIGLIFQLLERTLLEEEVNMIMQKILQGLIKADNGITLRE